MAMLLVQASFVSDSKLITQILFTMKKAFSSETLELRPWFKTWFDTNWYHKLYSYRNEREAGSFLQKLIAELVLDPNSRIVDVGCGTGRHSKFLAGYGFKVTGFDLSPSSIREAKKMESLNLRFLVHDMRMHFGSEIFDTVLNLFTSFGYFNIEEENEMVIANMATALKPGGKLVIDYLNIKFSDQNLIPSEQKEIDGIMYYITRWTDEKFFYKRIRVGDNQIPIPMEYTEQVRRFTLDDFERMFKAIDLELDTVYGDYQLNNYDKSNSPRLIMIARKVGSQSKEQRAKGKKQAFPHF